MVLRTRDCGVHLLQLAAKSVSDGNGRARSMFHRNISQTGRQRDSGEHKSGELRIEIHAGADAETVRAIIQALKEC